MNNIQNKILPQKDCEWMICLFNFPITDIPMKNIQTKILPQKGCGWKYAYQIFPSKNPHKKFPKKST